MSGIFFWANSPIFTKDLQLLGQVFFPGETVRVATPADWFGPEVLGEEPEQAWQITVSALPVGADAALDQDEPDDEAEAVAEAEANAEVEAGAEAEAAAEAEAVEAVALAEAILAGEATVPPSAPVLAPAIPTRRLPRSTSWSVSLHVRGPKGVRQVEKSVGVEPGASPRTVDHAVRHAAQGLLVDVLAELTGFHPGWGILTGVRPTKLVHYMLDQGVSDPVAELTTTYRLTPEKANLVTEVARFQRPFLMQDPRAISLYIGIPFCPTICSFCSFSIYPINEHRGELPTFFDALHREMEIIGNAIQELGLRVETIYFGGGTPTSMNDQDFAAMIKQAERTLLKGQSPKEYTVEGGRPETFTRHKLDTMAAAGVSRVSVNPQTTVQSTLMHLGRIHTSEKFYRAYDLVRSHSHPFIVNCDTIIGLPGEGRAEVEHTLNDMKRLDPENLTVHTLAIKRGSRLHRTEGAAAEALTRLAPDEAEELVRYAAQTARSLGQHPYYLYRQKYMVGSMENVGYAKPGTESLYNIQMMEERQTVIGLGAGATSKWYKPLGENRGWLMQAKDNPNEPHAYSERAEVNAWERVRQLRLVYDV